MSLGEWVRTCEDKTLRTAELGFLAGLGLRVATCRVRTPRAQAGRAGAAPGGGESVNSHERCGLGRRGRRTRVLGVAGLSLGWNWQPAIRSPLMLTLAFCASKVVDDLGLLASGEELRSRGLWQGGWVRVRKERVVAGGSSSTTARSPINHRKTWSTKTRSALGKSSTGAP